MENKISKFELIELVNKAISILQIDENEAVKLLHPYVPPNGPVTIDYGIYALQYALIFGEMIFVNKENSEENLPIKISKMFEACKTTNNKEYIKLIEWFSTQLLFVHNQMKRAKVNLLIDDALHSAIGELKDINPIKSQNLVLSLQMDAPNFHLLANAYKDLYEISTFLILLANLISIPLGQAFTNNPFKNKIINGRNIQDRNENIIKGLAVEWLEQQGDIFVKEIIRHSYNAELRNLVGGHNNYHFDETDETYQSVDKKTVFTYTEVNIYFTKLELLYSALRLDGITRYFEDGTHPAKINQVGYIDWGFNDEGDTLLISQYWANFIKQDFEELPSKLSFYRPPFERDGKFISLGFDNKYIIPYDLRVIANEKSLLLMESLLNKDSITVILAGVAPPVPPFTSFSKARRVINGKEMVIFGGKEIAMEIDKPTLISLLEYLRS